MAWGRGHVLITNWLPLGSSPQHAVPNAAMASAHPNWWCEPERWSFTSPASLAPSVVHLWVLETLPPSVVVGSSVESTMMSTFSISRGNTFGVCLSSWGDSFFWVKWLIFYRILQQWAQSHPIAPILLWESTERQTQEKETTSGAASRNTFGQYWATNSSEIG